MSITKMATGRIIVRKTSKSLALLTIIACIRRRGIRNTILIVLFVVSAGRKSHTRREGFVSHAIVESVAEKKSSVLVESVEEKLSTVLGTRGSASDVLPTLGIIVFSASEKGKIFQSKKDLPLTIMASVAPVKPGLIVELLSLMEIDHPSGCLI